MQKHVNNIASVHNLAKHGGTNFIDETDNNCCLSDSDNENNQDVVIENDHS